MKKSTIIALPIIFGVAFGNISGLIISSIFFKENLGIGLVIGNSLGISLGLIIFFLLFIIYSYLYKCGK